MAFDDFLQNIQGETNIGIDKIHGQCYHQVTVLMAHLLSHQDQALLVGYGLFNTPVHLEHVSNGLQTIE